MLQCVEIDNYLNSLSLKKVSNESSPNLCPIEEIDVEIDDFDYDINLKDHDLSNFSFAKKDQDLEDLFKGQEVSYSELTEQFTRLCNGEEDVKITLSCSDKENIEEKRLPRSRKRKTMSTHYEYSEDFGPCRNIRVRKENFNSRHNMSTRSRKKFQNNDQEEWQLAAEPVVKGSGSDMIGGYNRVERELLIKRYLEKRKRRVWHKKVKYTVRKTFADSRMRVKGRFISKVDEASLREALLMSM